MEFGLSDEQQMIVGSVRRFVQTELIPLEGEIEKTGHLDLQRAKEIFEKSRALGFYAMNIPEQYGGAGLSAVDTMLVEEQFGHTKDILIRRAFGNVYESLLAGTAPQKDRWLLPAVRGERTCSIALASASRVTAVPPMTNRSVTSTRCGEV